MTILARGILLGHLRARAVSKRFCALVGEFGSAQMPWFSLLAYVWGLHLRLGMAAFATSRARRTPSKGNSSFVATSLSQAQHEAREWYEMLYCARGELENRSWEHLSTSTERTVRSLRADQLSVSSTASEIPWVCAPPAPQQRDLWSCRVPAS